MTVIEDDRPPSSKPGPTKTFKGPEKVNPVEGVKSLPKKVKPDIKAKEPDPLVNRKGIRVATSARELCISRGGCNALEAHTLLVLDCVLRWATLPSGRKVRVEMTEHKGDT